MTPDRANIIRNAIINDPSVVGSQGWCDDHYIQRHEFEEFIDNAVRYVEETGGDAAEVEMTFLSNSAKVGDSEAKWSVRIPKSMTSAVDRIAETGTVIATIRPRQGALFTDTGEIV